MTIKLGEIEARAKAATEGPWEEVAFTAHSRTDVPEMAAWIRRAAEDLLDYRENVCTCRSVIPATVVNGKIVEGNAEECGLCVSARKLLAEIEL